MAEFRILEQSVRASVLIALGISGLCSAFYGLNWLDTGQGNWKTLFDGTAAIAGPTAVFALAVNLFVRWREGRKAS